MKYVDFTELPENMRPYPGHFLCVGWLDESDDFPKGQIDHIFLEKLFSILKSPFNVKRHLEFCPI